MGYLVSVDVVPDTRCEEQEEYENELIENGQAARCEECGQVFDDVLSIGNDGAKENVICADCAEDEEKLIIKTVQRLSLEAANKEERRRIATAMCFLSDYSDEFKQYLRENY